MKIPLMCLLVLSQFAMADMQPQVSATLAPQVNSAPLATSGQAIAPATTVNGAPLVFGQPASPAAPRKARKKSKGRGEELMRSLPGLLGNLGTSSSAGTASAPSTSSPVATQARPASMPSTSICGPGLSQGSCWMAAMSVEGEQIIPPGAGYDINAAAWPKLVDRGGTLEVEYPGRESMCTSATAAAFLKSIADRVNSGQLNLTASQLAWLNGPQVRELLNGNTYSFAVLNEALGGQNVAAKNAASIRHVLAQAQAGDVMKIDRANGTGHSTIFKEVRGDQVCYWSSQKSQTNGVGEKCEPISRLTTVAVSRMPSNAVLNQSIQTAVNSPKITEAIARTQNGSVPESAVDWNSQLTCDEPTNQNLPTGRPSTSDVTS